MSIAQRLASSQSPDSNALIDCSDGSESFHGLSPCSLSTVPGYTSSSSRTMKTSFLHLGQLYGFPRRDELVRSVDFDHRYHGINHSSSQRQILSLYHESSSTFHVRQFVKCLRESNTYAHRLLARTANHQIESS